MMMAPKAIIAAQDAGLRPDHFSRPSQGLICRAIYRIDARGETPDAITVISELEKHGKLDSAGGKQAVFTPTQVVTSTANAGSYASIIVEAAVNRNLKRAATQIVELVDGPGEALEKVSQAESLVAAVNDTAEAQEAQTMADSVEQVFADIEAAYKSGAERRGLATGFTRIDKMTRGLFPGQLIIVAAGTGMGKSTFAQNIVEFAAKKGKGAALFSLEMSNEEVALRIISNLSRVPYDHIQTAKLDSGEYHRLTEAVEKLKTLPIYGRDEAQVTMANIRAQARRLKRQKQIELLVIDYLQLMVPDGKPENQNVAIGQITRGLKLLARELAVPVIALSQLNRGIATRSEKRPVLSDLRDSGSIEQDADCVMFIHREEYYDPETTAKGEAEVIIAKQRQGPTGTVKLAFVGNTFRFANLARDTETAPVVEASPF